MAAGGIQNSYSASAGNSIGTAFSAVELNGASALGGKHIGSQCFLDKILFTWKSISTAANFTWYLAYDSGGEYPITDPQEAVVFKVGKTGTTKVNAADLAGCAYRYTNSGSTIYLIAKVDAGTAAADITLLWRAR